MTNETPRPCPIPAPPSDYVPALVHMHCGQPMDLCYCRVCGKRLDKGREAGPMIDLYTVECLIQGAPAPVRYDERPFPDAVELATLLAWMSPAARVEVHGRTGLVGLVHNGAVRDPYTGVEL